MRSMLSEGLEILRCQNQIAMHGIEGLKVRPDQEKRTTAADEFRAALYEKIRNDLELRHPHMKIIHYLAGQYNYQEGSFLEVHYSRLVKECRIGKNKASEYLGLLIDKGLIETRSDGYRRFYMIKQYDI